MINTLVLDEELANKELMPFWEISTAQSSGIINYFREIWQSPSTPSVVPSKFNRYRMCGRDRVMEYDQQSVQPSLNIETSSAERILFTKNTIDLIGIESDESDIAITLYPRNKRKITITILNRTKGPLPIFDENDFLFD